MRDAGRWYSVAAIFFGIVAVLTSVIFFIGFPAAVLAIFFGTLAVKRYYRKTGTTSIILGIVGIVLTVIVFVNIINALNVSNLVVGSWILNDGEQIQINENGTYLWYKDNLDENYTRGDYTLSTGMYKANNKYVMGYTVSFNQKILNEKGKELDELYTHKYLIYQEEKAGQEYQIMDMQTGQINEIIKQKNDLWWWIF